MLGVLVINFLQVTNGRYAKARRFIAQQEIVTNTQVKNDFISNLFISQLFQRQKCHSVAFVEVYYKRRHLKTWRFRFCYSFVFTINMNSPQHTYTSGSHSDTYFTSEKSPNYKRAGSVIGYTGFYPKEAEPPHVLGQSLTKPMIQGYTGHRPFRKQVIGMATINTMTETEVLSSENSAQLLTAENFRVYAKHLDLEERYATAVQVLEDNGMNI